MKTNWLLRLFVFLLWISLLIMISLYVFINWKKENSVRDLPEISENNALNVVTEFNSIGFYGVGDSIGGVQYDLCRFISKRSGFTINLYIENDLETAIRKLEKNEYDVIAQNIPVTNENKQFLAFTVPVTQSKQVLVQRKRVDSVPGYFIANQLDLAHRTIHVTRNSPAILRLNNLAEEIAEPVYIREIAGYNSEQLIEMVNNNEIEYAVVDNEIAIKNIPLFPGLDFNTEISFTQLQAWALRKTSPVLLDSLNVWITAFKLNNRKKK